ncbi:hypothetical protein AB0424_27340 [Streptomyces sp. NPDC051180]|uniref:hypothetical protein n=1 Tax=Streptomyces sp. NPDC051180 TaxID=3155797 RepID=UPI00344E5EA1
MVVGIVIAAMGVACAVWGGMFLFNVRGAADRAAERRNAVRAVTAARTGDLALLEPSRFKAGFFRVLGGFLVPGGLFMGLVGAVIATIG